MPHYCFTFLAHDSKSDTGDILYKAMAVSTIRSMHSMHMLCMYISIFLVHSHVVRQGSRITALGINSHYLFSPPCQHCSYFICRTQLLEAALSYICTLQPILGQWTHSWTSKLHFWWIRHAASCVYSILCQSCPHMWDWNLETWGYCRRTGNILFI